MATTVKEKRTESIHVDDATATLAEMGRQMEGGHERPACSACGFVQYMNPAPGAGVIVMRGDTVCLVKRKFEPKKGEWCFPTGFMEWDEDVRLHRAG